MIIRNRKIQIQIAHTNNIWKNIKDMNNRVHQKINRDNLQINTSIVNKTEKIITNHHNLIQECMRNN